LRSSAAKRASPATFPQRPHGLNPEKLAGGPQNGCSLFVDDKSIAVAGDARTPGNGIKSRRSTPSVRPDLAKRQTDDTRHHVVDRIHVQARHPATAIMIFARTKASFRSTIPWKSI
jgi:hypothetical protein